MYPQRGDDYYEMEAGLLFFFLSGGGYLFHSRGVLLSASPARWGCTPAIIFSFFFRWWKQKSCLRPAVLGGG